MGVIIPQVVTNRSGAQVIDGSLKFDSSYSQHLTRTPGSAGNRRTWTWSGWVKRVKLGDGTVSSDEWLLRADSGGSDFFLLGFGANDSFYSSYTAGVSAGGENYTATVFRDISSWYHMVFAFDTTQTTATDRVKMYVNGVQQTLTVSNSPALNSEYQVNSANLHRIGGMSGSYADFHLTEINFIDGQALGPEYFGFTDPLTNTWKPKKYTGTFTGTNTFYLPLDGSAPIGQDQSGQGNNWTPQNFGGSVALDNPQVSGARPILNTTQGGTQAGVGVFGSRENVGYAVTVYNDGGGNKYYIDGVKQDTVTGLIRGATYTFDTSDSTVSSHPFRFSATSNGSHGGGSEYTNGVAAITGAATTITVPYDAPNTLYYYCTSHSGMGADITGITTNEKLADQYASHCVLAVPFVGGTEDASVRLACTSTTKTDSLTNSPTSSSLGNFYRGSREFVGSNGQRINYSNSAQFDFGTSDFTMEGWYYHQSKGVTNSARRYFVHTESTWNGNKWIIYTSFTGYVDKATFYTYPTYSTNGSAPHLTGTTTFAVGNWYHIAVTRSGNTFRLFVNGILEDSADSSTSVGDSTNDIQIGGGSVQTDRTLYGNVQDVRIYKGVAKYTSDFVVPSTSPDILPDTPSGVSGSSKLTKITDGAVSFDGNGDYLTAPVDSSFEFGTGDFTVECWLYLTNNTGYQPIVLLGNGASGGPSVISYAAWYLFYESGTGLRFYRYDGTETSYSFSTTLSTNNWYNIAVSRSGTSLRCFVDGTQIGSTVTTSLSYNKLNNDNLHIGRALSGTNSGTINYLNGYISNLRIIKETALYTSRFTPPTAPLTNVTNTSLLCCQSNTSATEAAVIPTGSITANGDAAATNFNPFNTDINTVRGQETGYATLNPLIGNAGLTNVTLSNGNLTFANSDTTYRRYVPSNVSMPLNTGKYYFEGVYTKSPDSNNAIYDGFGLIDTALAGEGKSGASNVTGVWVYRRNGNKNNQAAGSNNPGETFGDSWGVGDVIGISYDSDNGIVSGYKNGVKQGDIATDVSVEVSFLVAGYNSCIAELNFGQKPFKFPPPDGFQPLNTANKRPVKVISRPDQHVGVATYSGDSSSNRKINLNLKPDLVWFKSRTAGNSNVLVDSVRGGNKVLYSDTTGGQVTASAISSFDIDGMTINDIVGNGRSVNNSGRDIVAWSWKAGGAAVSNTDGSITSQVSANQTAGFSIVSYTGTGANATVGHGLGKAPSFVITKRTGSTGNWLVQHKSAGVGYLLLNGTNAYAGGDPTAWNSTFPTSSVFSVGTGIVGNQIAYCWAEIEGFSKFGSYVGNGNANGPFVELGFLPSVIIIKRSDGGTENWTLWDATRNPSNVMGKQLYPNLSIAEADAGTNSSYGILDFVSNGVKIRGSHSSFNSSGHTFIYAAWAAAPSVDLYGGGANAR